MDRNYVPAKVYRDNDPGLRRLLTVASHLSPLQAVGQAVMLVVSTAIGVAGAAVGAWLIWWTTRRALATPFEFGLAWGFFVSLGTGVWIVGIAVLSFLWLISMAVAWPSEDNDLAKALYGPPV
ncbi:hypothetical protein PM030_14170 [Halorubrum ezzemoulense]|uniref:hypothetical protein n=1 Tax=Halorubrum ezzemoulense TaxID=337243 RepID=UPI00232E8E0B|nr:hypothetical protein [Halorubrum ezzemoulense]MDB2283019.1 hypothetical protein [Halorubrum ezzemoulense]